MLYETLRPIVRVALRWYYRSITVANAERVPPHGPVFLAVNHPNALVDALVIGAVVPRRVRFTAKATIFANPLAARFFRAAGVVPLRRASDEAKRGGAPKDGAPESAVAASANDPARNAASFDAVADALAEGSAIVIFPEGKSHDAPGLAPLRTGLARMTALARERGVRGIRIVPVGLVFEHKEEPRTRVLVQVGDPIDVDAFPTGTASIAALTDAVTARLAAVTLNFADADDAARVALAGETLGALVEPTRAVGEDVTPLAVSLSLARRITRARATLAATGDAEIARRVAAFEERLRGFRARLGTLGIMVEDVAIAPGSAPGARFVVREGAIALALAPLVVWGRLVHLLPLRLTRALALHNVRARDEPAMRTVVIGFVLVLLAYAALALLVWRYAGVLWALLLLATLIPSATADFRFGDRLRRARARARAWREFRRDPSLQPALLAEADWLRNEAGALERLAADTATATAKPRTSAD